MHCFVCNNCYCVITKQTNRCPACKSNNLYYDKYGIVRRLIVNCISELTDDEVAVLAESMGCPDINRSDMYDVIGKLIN